MGGSADAKHLSDLHLRPAALPPLEKLSDLHPVPLSLHFRRLFAYSVPVLRPDDRRRVYMSFQCRDGWHCQFLEQDLKTSLPPKLHFTSSDKLVELVERGGGFTDQESRLMLNQAIVTGRGGVFLNLTAEHTSQKRGPFGRFIITSR